MKLAKKIKGSSPFARTGCYNRILEKKDAVDLEKKVSALLSIDTASSGYYDYSKLDLRHLITLKYGENISSIWIGFSRSGLMFVNGKIFKRDDLILKEISKYILDKRLNKNIRKYIKMWNEPKK